MDLGATPGAWSQYLRRRFAPEGAAAGELRGTIIALDLLDFEPIEGVHFIQGDFREEAVAQQLHDALGGKPVDVVVSDMAPNLSGIEVTDAARIEHLVELAVDFAVHHLRPEGALVCKCFHGSGYNTLVHAVQAHLPDRQADQTQGLARQVGRNLSGRRGTESPLTCMRKARWHGALPSRASDTLFTPLHNALPDAPIPLTALESTPYTVDCGVPNPTRRTAELEKEPR